MNFFDGVASKLKAKLKLNDNKDKIHNNDDGNQEATAQELDDIVEKTAFERAQQWLKVQDNRFFLVIGEMYENEDEDCSQLGSKLNWKDKDNLNFLFSPKLSQSAQYCILKHILPSIEGMKLYRLFMLKTKNNKQFLSQLNLTLKLVLLPFLGFQRVLETTETKRTKASNKMRLSDLNVAADHSRTENNMEILSHVNRIMDPYQMARRHVASRYKDEDIIDSVAELCLLIMPNEPEMQYDTLVKLIPTLPISQLDLFKPFDLFLQKLTDEVTQEKRAYAHHLLWFFQRGAIMHSDDTSVIAYAMKNIMEYFDKHGKLKKIDLFKNPKNPELLFHQQLYFSHLLVMGIYFSDKNWMNKNIRAHVNRIIYSQENSAFYKVHDESERPITVVDREYFDDLFHGFGDLVHMQSTLFMVEAKNFSNAQIKALTTDNTKTITVGNGIPLKATPLTIGHYLRFIQIFLEKLEILSPAEINCLCYNPDFCIQLFKNYLTKSFNFDNVPELDGLLSHLVNETPRLQPYELQRLRVKAWQYCQYFDDLQVSGKNIGEKRMGDAAINACCAAVLPDDWDAALCSAPPLNRLT